jgi:hypothetical protein
MRMAAPRYRGGSLAPVTAETRVPHDLLESVLELRDQVIGLQAQIDEIHARVDDLEQRVGRRHGFRARLARVLRNRRRSPT